MLCVNTVDNFQDESLHGHETSIPLQEHSVQMKAAMQETEFLKTPWKQTLNVLFCRYLQQKSTGIIRLILECISMRSLLSFPYRHASLFRSVRTQNVLYVESESLASYFLLSTSLFHASWKLKDASKSQMRLKDIDLLSILSTFI